MLLNTVVINDALVNAVVVWEDMNEFLGFVGTEMVSEGFIKKLYGR